MRVVPVERADTSCDTLVVLGTETRDGHTPFAKNSDRPPTECQPLFQVPRRRHPARATVRSANTWKSRRQRRRSLSSGAAPGGSGASSMGSTSAGWPSVTRPCTRGRRPGRRASWAWTWFGWGRGGGRRTVENPDLRYRAEARLAASCRFLAEDPQPGVASLMRHLRDHHEGGTVHLPGRRDGDPLGWSVGMHQNRGVSATAASLIAELPEDPADLMTL